MAPLRALIIDDDTDDCALLRRHLERAAPDARVVGEVHSLAAARERLGRNGYDVVFLDLQFPDGSGFDLVPFVGPDAALIFVTGHDTHAARAFDVNAADYLVKPVSGSRLTDALSRVARARGSKPEPLCPFNSSDRIFLRGGTARGRFVYVRDIVAIFASENYSEVLVADGEKWLVRHTMRAWEESLPSELFARVHRTLIVNLSRVERVERAANEQTSLQLRGVHQPLPVGRRLWTDLKARLGRREKT